MLKSMKCFYVSWICCNFATETTNELKYMENKVIIEKVLDILSNESEVKDILRELDDSALSLYENFSVENIMYFYSRFAWSKEKYKEKFIRLVEERLNRKL